MKKQNIFIHIPKTGGTTINCVMNKSQWQTEINFFYRHISYETKRSNSKDIFNPLNYDKYIDYNIFMLLRHPLDRIISEYYFIKDRHEFLSLLKPKPKNFKEYIQNKQTQNYMIGFLLGKRIFDTDTVKEDDLELVINTIKNLPIHVGIYEHYQESLNYFDKILGIKWPKKIDVKRITLNRPELNEISDKLKNYVLENNDLDNKLYQYCLEIFKQKVHEIPKKNFIFKKNKFDYVLKYTERFCLLEIELKYIKFIHFNQDFFQKLNIYLQKNLNIKNGKTYVELWNKAFVNSIMKNFPNSILLKEIELVIDKKNDPLDQTKKIAKAIDDVFLRKEIKNIKKYEKKLYFDESLVKKPSFFRIF